MDAGAAEDNVDERAENEGVPNLGSSRTLKKGGALKVAGTLEKQDLPPDLERVSEISVKACFRPTGRC